MDNSLFKILFNIFLKENNGLSGVYFLDRANTKGWESIVDSGVFGYVSFMKEKKIIYK